MHTVAVLVEPNLVESLTTPMNYRLGQRLCEGDHVTINSITSYEIVAHVGGKLTQPRIVILRDNKGKLAWQCSCSKDTDHLCKHAVAAALTAWDTAPIQPA